MPDLHSSIPSVARSRIPAQTPAQQSGPTAHYRVGSASPGGVNRGRPLPTGGTSGQAAWRSNPWSANRAAPTGQVLHPAQALPGMPGYNPRPTTGPLVPQSATPSPIPASAYTYSPPTPPRSVPQAQPKPSVGPVQAWNNVARSGGTATQAGQAATIASRFSGAARLPVQALGAVGGVALAAQLPGLINDAVGSTVAVAATAYAAGKNQSVGGILAAQATPFSAAAAAAGAVAGAIGSYLDPNAITGPPIPSTTITAKGDPPFTGGQSPGVQYRVAARIYLPGQDPNICPSFYSGSHAGPIKGLRKVGTSPGPQQWYLDHGNPTQSRALQSFNAGQQESQGRICNIQRLDGAPDTGGNPAGPEILVPAPMPAPRSNTEALSAPRSTRDETALNLPSRLTPPAPLSFPTPAAVPAGTPQAEPPAPESLPPGHPLQSPTPTNPMAPAEVPAPATPETVPAGLPAGLPGAGGQSKDRQEIDGSWVIPPLLIGGGLAIGTAIATGLRIDDPTTPGRFTQVPPTPTPPRIETPAGNPCKCNGPILNKLDQIGGNNAAIQAQLARIEGNQINPVSGFAALQVGQAGILGFMQTMNTFMRKAWETTRMQKVLDVLTFIGVMHNVSMLSRDVGETFFQVLGQGIQAVGIRDEEDQPIDLYSAFTGGLETFLRNVLGSEVYDGVAETWNRANRIISTASSVIWTVRSIADASQDLLEWIGENTGRIGNALKRWGVVGERDYPWMSESAKAQHRLRSRFDKITGALENAEDRISVYGQATSTVLEVQQEVTELSENFGRFRESVVEGIPDPWADNEPVQVVYETDKAASAAPDISVNEAQQG